MKRVGFGELFRFCGITADPNQNRLGRGGQATDKHHGLGPGAPAASAVGSRLSPWGDRIPRVAPVPRWGSAGAPPRAGIVSPLRG